MTDAAREADRPHSPDASTSAVRRHVWQLLALGHTVASVAGQAGVAKGTVDRLMANWTRVVRQRVAEAILAVPLVPPPAPTCVRATGTKRRIQALATRGWSQGAIGAELGRTQASIGVLLTRQVIKATTAAMIAELYERIRDTPPDSRSNAQRVTRSRAQTEAFMRGWAPPEAWDHTDIDDPKATPSRTHTNPSAVLHALTTPHPG